MDTVEMMRVFSKVAQRSSFIAAARELHISSASVTKYVAAIEARVGARLLDRTTRSVRMTEAGRIYFDRCQECLQAFDDADASIGELTAEPRGLLRVAGPFDFMRHFNPILMAFLEAHPAVRLDVRMSNRTLDMVDEGIDVYLRVTNQLDAEFVARPLAITRLALWGSPSYFRRHGRPRAPADLAKHRFALFDEPPLLDRVTLVCGKKRVPLRLEPVVVSNSGDVLVEAVCAGRALALLPSFLVPPKRAGRFELVLPGWSLGHRGVFAVYPHRRFVPAKVRAFVEGLRRTLGDPTRDPWWPAELSAAPEVSSARR